MGCRECCAQFGLLVLRLLNMVVGVRHLGVWVWAGLDNVWYHIFSRLAIVLCGPQLVGAGFVAYGAYLYAENGAGISGWAYTMMGVGLVVMVLALSLVLCGYKRPWFIKLVRVRGGSIAGIPWCSQYMHVLAPVRQYLAVFGFLFVGEVMMTCYFLIPSAREKIIDSIHPPAVRRHRRVLSSLWQPVVTSACACRTSRQK